MTTELKDKIICILHNYLDNPCYICEWFNHKNKKVRCNIFDEECTFNVSDKGIKEMAKVINMVAVK